MRPLRLLLAGATLIAGCAGVPPARLPERDRVDAFGLEARFALRLTPADQPAQSSGGRLSWEHRRNGDRILVASPLGVGLAEIESDAGGSRLRTADGKEMTSPDADALMEEVTGQRLPVTQLPAWLLGRPGRGGRLEHDAQGRPARLAEAGWQIDYGYDDAAPGALPSRLTLSREREIELRLRIEEWRDGR